MVYRVGNSNPLWISILGFCATTILGQSTDCKTVLAVYKAMGGITWETNGCLLGGVTEVNGKVTKIEWDRYPLSEPIPPQIGNLKNLKELILNDMPIYGPIPKEIGKLTNLEILSISWIDITGSIPKEIGNAINLKEFFLAGTQITGAIPAEIGNLKQLKIIYLPNNKLTGSIPEEIGKLTQLEWIYLPDNQITGVPNSMNQLQADKYALVEIK
jgi:hypothetical protein